MTKANALGASKTVVRESMWSVLDRHGVSNPLGAAGRIPRFGTADAAAERLTATAAWASAEVLKVNPDTAQLPVRRRALAEGKVVYMAVPYLDAPSPFYVLDPAELGGKALEAATIDGATKLAPVVGFEGMREIDLVVCGSVVVNRDGARLGKGGGYADIEVALLVETGLITVDTVLATTVHELQVVSTELPETVHDFRLDVIASPTQVLYCRAPYRPTGIYPSHLTAAKIASIPVLRDRLGRRPHTGGPDNRGLE